MKLMTCFLNRERQLWRINEEAKKGYQEAGESDSEFLLFVADYES